MPNIKISKSTIELKKASRRNTTKRPSARIEVAMRSTPKEGTGDPLTKNILIKAASEGFSKAAAKTMKVMGYNVIAKNGWVVKKFADGRIEKISKLKSTNKPVILD